MNAIFKKEEMKKIEGRMDTLGQRGILNRHLLLTHLKVMVPLG
jgi:hypothetical protein